MQDNLKYFNRNLMNKNSKIILNKINSNTIDFISNNKDNINNNKIIKNININNNKIQLWKSSLEFHSNIKLT